MMGLNFTALLDLAKTNGEKQGAAPIQGAYIPPILKRKQEGTRFLLELAEQMQGNIMRAGDLRAEILKGAAAGMDDRSLFLLAAECIAAMTGDSTFLAQIKRHK